MGTQRKQYRITEKEDEKNERKRRDFDIRGSVQWSRNVK
jgi:hypothetical protein